MTASQIRRIGLAVGILLVAGSASARALGGCVVSPENPTLILGMIGSGAASLPWLREKLRSRFDKKQ